MRYHRGSPRAFILIPQDGHRREILERTRQMLNRTVGPALHDDRVGGRMAETTKISWTNHTFNPWIGCQSVSPGCDNCYAEALTNRHRWTEWGPDGERKRTSPAYWKKPLAWDRRAKEMTGKRSWSSAPAWPTSLTTRRPQGQGKTCGNSSETLRTWTGSSSPNGRRTSTNFSPKTGTMDIPTSGWESAPRTRMSTDAGGPSWPEPRHSAVHLLRAGAGTVDLERTPGETGLADLGRGVGNSPQIPQPILDTQYHAGMPPGESGRVWKTVGCI